MFAIVDIETTGGTPAHGHKITDICILIHDGLSVVDKFCTLINPERTIPEYITRLTGINNEMVAHAPKFYEVAKDIVQFTEGKIFVAHNVSFDYGFVQSEYASLGYDFSREKLCTVKLSRKLLPKRISYSLGRLCESLGIENQARHRAEGDAVATARLFEILLAEKSRHPVYRRQNIDQLNTSRIDNIKKYILKKLPESTGVYYFLNREKEVLYIGKSKNARDRAIAHFNSGTKKSKELLNELSDVDFVPTGSELIALLLESEEIKSNRPPYNKLRKQEIFSHCIDSFKDKNGVQNLAIVPYEEARQPLLSFVNYTTARERLEEWMEKHRLCMKYCGLSEKELGCFYYEVRKCNGICCGKEEATLYNRRVAQIIKTYSYRKPSFVIIDKGRTASEKSLILVKDNKYSGFGYIDESESITDPSAWVGYIRDQRWHPDADILVQGWMRKNQYQIVQI